MMEKCELMLVAGYYQQMLVINLYQHQASIPKLLMWVKQCHKPPMWDLLIPCSFYFGVVYGIVLPTLHTMTNNIQK